MNTIKAQLNYIKIYSLQDLIASLLEKNMLREGLQKSKLWEREISAPSSHIPFVFF